ncbi:MAG: hypothetical protein H6582_04740 [Crocinitomicaceae bacterium]|nr:hypothetical protein [Crocinitomicaceae bacterium]
MTDSFDEVLEESAQPKGVPGIVKTLAVISYIGNAIWGLLFLAVGLMVNSLGGLFVNRIESATLSSDQLMRNVMLVSLGIFIVCVINFIGALLMHRGKKRGFYFYAITNLIWAYLIYWILGETVQGAVCGLISVLFIAGFGMNLKKLNT